MGNDKKCRNDTLLKVVSWFPNLAVTKQILACPEDGTAQIDLITGGRDIRIEITVGEVVD